MANEEPRPKFLGSKVFITFVVCLTIYTDVFAYGLVVPVLPYALLTRCGVSPEDLQTWTTVMMASYGGMILVGAMLFGWVGDRMESHRWTFVLGQGLLLCGTVVVILARSLPVFLIGRIICGAAAGAVLTIGYSLLFDTVGPTQIGQAAGYTSMSLSLGIFSGPLVGGFLYDTAGYEAVFAPALALIGLEIIMRLLVIEPPRYRSPKSDDSERQKLLDEQQVNRSPTTPRVDTFWERAEDNNELPKTSSEPARDQPSPLLVLLCDPRVIVTMLAQVVINCFGGALETVVPVYAYERFGLTSTQIALLFLCVTLPQFAGPVSGWLADRFGSKWPAFAGFSLGVPAFVLMRVVDEDGPNRVALLCVAMALAGATMSLTLSPVYAELALAVEGIEHRKPGVFGERGAFTLAFGLEHCAFGAGAMAGPLCAGLVRARFGWSSMSLMLGVASLVMAVIAFLFIGDNYAVRILHRQRRDQEHGTGS